LDSLIPASKISNLTQGMFVGAVSDNFDERIEQKIFHAQIIVDNEKVAAETKAYEKIPEVLSFTDANGNDTTKEQKNQTSVRLVGNVNATFKASEQLTFSGSYSNFSTTTNRRLNQFDYINHPNMNPADTLSYRQLSQMGNLNANYIFGKENNQNINLNYSIAGQANEQGGIIRKGQANTVQNVNLSHSIAFPIAITLNTSVNYTRNDAGALHSNIYGS